MPITQDVDINAITEELKVAGYTDAQISAYIERNFGEQQTADTQTDTTYKEEPIAEDDREEAVEVQPEEESQENDIEAIRAKLLDAGYDESKVEAYINKNYAKTATEEEPKTPEEIEQEREIAEQAFRGAHAAIPGAASIVADLPDWLLEPYAAFESTLLGIGAGVVDFASQQVARFDDDLQEQLENAAPEERLKIWEDYNNAGDTIREASENIGKIQGQYGSGSISTEFSKGNIGNAAQLTVNQTASGLASLVPFFVPGGQVLGPVVLGTSAAGSAFEEDIADIDKTGDATINQIYNASYLKGGVELATEFVTGGIVGRAKKLAGGGAGKEAVGEFTRSAWKRVAGESFKEGVSEGLADTGSRAVDHYVYGAEFDPREAAVGFIDSAIIGAIIGGKVSGFGEIAADRSVAKEVAAKVLRPESKVDEDQSRAEEFQKNQDIIAQTETTGSLIDDAVREAASVRNNEIVEEQRVSDQAHKEALEDMTVQELAAYAKSMDQVKKLEQAHKSLDPNSDEAVNIRDRITEIKDGLNTQYQTVFEWPATIEQADGIKQQIKEKREELDLKEEQLAKAEKPNPVSTKKIKEEREELDAKEKGLNQTLEAVRPGKTDATLFGEVKETSRHDVARQKSRRFEGESEILDELNIAKIDADPNLTEEQKFAKIQEISERGNEKIATDEDTIVQEDGSTTTGYGFDISNVDVKGKRVNFSDIGNIVQNKKAVYDNLPEEAKTAHFAGGLFSNGVPSDAAISTYYSGKEASKKVTRLAEAVEYDLAMFDNVTRQEDAVQKLDEFFKEVAPDFNIEYDSSLRPSTRGGAITGLLKTIINPTATGASTLPHEFKHHYTNLVRDIGTKEEKAFLNKGIELAKQTGAYQKYLKRSQAKGDTYYRQSKNLAKADNIPLQEAQKLNAALEVISELGGQRQVLQLDKKKGIVQELIDWVSNFKEFLIEKVTGLSPKKAKELLGKWNDAALKSATQEGGVFSRAKEAKKRGQLKRDAQKDAEADAKRFDKLNNHPGWGTAITWVRRNNKNLPKDWFKQGKYLDMIQDRIDVWEAKNKSKADKHEIDDSLQGLVERRDRLIDTGVASHKPKINKLNERIAALKNEQVVQGILNKIPEIPSKTDPNYDKASGEKKFYEYTAEIEKGKLQIPDGDSHGASHLRDINSESINKISLGVLKSDPKAVYAGAASEIGFLLLPTNTLAVDRGLQDVPAAAAMEEIRTAQYEAGDFALSMLKDAGLLDVDTSYDPETDRTISTVRIVDDNSFDLVKENVNTTDRTKGRFKHPVKVTDKASEKMNYTGPVNEMGNPMVHNIPVSDYMPNTKKFKKVYKQINKANNTEHLVNKDVLKVYKDLVGEGNGILDLKGNKNYNEDQTKLEEDKVQQTLDIAEKLGKTAFKQMYFYQPTGRMSPETQGLNHQASKRERSLFLFNNQDKIGKVGYDRLLADVISQYGIDNTADLPIDSKIDLGKDKLEELIEWANNPLEFKEEISKAKEPEMFLASLLELKNATNEDLTPNHEYKTGLPVYYDAKNSGVQHYVGMTKDSNAALWVNLMAGKEPNDAYRKINENLEAELSKKRSTPELEAFNKVNADMKKLMDRLSKAKDKKTVEKIKSKIKEYGKYNKQGVPTNKDVIAAAKVFFSQNNAFKNLRDISKKAVVPKLYGAGVDVMGDAIMDNFGSEYADLNKLYADWISGQISSGYEKTFPGAVNGRKLLQKMADILRAGGKPLEKGQRRPISGKPVILEGKVNGFRMVFDPKEPKVIRIYSPFRKKHVSVTIGDSDVTNTQDMLKGVAARVVQFMDAQHVAWMYENTNYPFMQVYDAFATTPTYAAQMHTDIQEGFTELYKDFDIADIVNDNLGVEEGGNLLADEKFELGDWDPDSTFENEFNFYDEHSPSPIKVTDSRKKGKFVSKEGEEVTKRRAHNLKKNITDLLNLRFADYKNNSPYKQSKITQEAREDIKALRRQFEATNKDMTFVEMQDFATKLSKAFKKGREIQLVKRTDIDKRRKEIGDSGSKIVNETTGLDTENLSSAKVKTEMKKNRSFIGRMKSLTPLGSTSDFLSPTGIDDFYGLVGRILPTKKGKNRTAAEKTVNETLFDPLKKAEYFEDVYAANIKDGNLGLRKKYGIKGRFLNKKTSIKIDGQTISNSQAGMIYNYIKDPRLHPQLIAGGVTQTKMKRIIDHVKSDENFRNYVDEYPTLFSKFEELINQKLDEHGYTGLPSHAIVSEQEAKRKEGVDKKQVEESYKLLREVYDGNIPDLAPYTPFVGKSDSDSLKMEEAVFGEGEGNYYSVMSGSLKSRTYTGEVDFIGKDMNTLVNNYASGPLRTVSYLDFAKNATAFFTTKNIKGFKTRLGESWNDNLSDSMKRIITGRIDSVKQPESVQTINKWLSRSISTVLFINPRSFILQLVSIPNFAFDNPAEYIKYMGAVNKNKESLKLIRESAFLKERGRGKTDVIFDQLLSQQDEGAVGKALDKLAEAGYIGTRAFDKIAISLGGAPYLSSRLDHYRSDPNLTEKQAVEKAMIDFTAKASEAQQSTKQSRLGRAQTTGSGRYLLAFQNATIQFNRKMSKSLRELQAGKNVPQNIYNISAILSLQIAGFSALQKAMDKVSGDEEEDRSKWESYLYGLLSTISTARGIAGAVIGTLIDLIPKRDRLYNPETGKVDHRAYDVVINEAINSFPAVGTKARLLKGSITKPYKQSEGYYDESEWITRSANAVEFVGLPTARLNKIIGSFNDIGSEDLETIEKLRRVGGWSRYDLTKPLGKFDDDQDDY